MNMMEMVLALFAVLFFTTVAMSYNRAVWDQTELLDNAGQYVQASHLAHAVLDEVDAKLFSLDLAFGDITTLYNSVTRIKTMAHTGGTYTLAINAVDCDSLGIPLTVEEINNIFVKVEVTVTTNGGLKSPVTMKRVYTKTHLNL